jgi:DHA1 family tetracycline resistance protein-like MFS transporter
LGTYDIRLPFYFAGGLTLLNWVYGCFVLPESLPVERRSPFRLGRTNPIGAFRVLSRYPLVAEMAVALFLLNMAQFGLHATWVLYTQERYEWTSLEVGVSLFLVGMGAAVVQAGLAKRVLVALGPGVLGERRGLILGLVVGVLAFIGYGTATEGWMIYAIICVASLGGIAMPASQALITKSVSPMEQGAVQGSLAGIQSVANVAGPLVGTNAFSYAIRAAREGAPWPLSAPGLSFYISAALAFLGLVVAAWATRRLVAPAPGGSPAVPQPEAPRSVEAEQVAASDLPGARR